MERYCSTRFLKNAKFLQSLEVRYLPELEPIDGFSSLVPLEILGRLHQTPPEEIKIEKLAQAIKKKRPPRPKLKPADPLFSGTLRFVRITFSSGGRNFAVPDFDLNVAMQYTGLVIAPISQYASQYGTNKLQLAGSAIPFNVSVTNGKYNDSILSCWVDQLAKANGLGVDSCPMFLNPQGVVNKDADPAQGVGGYHNISSSGVPYAFVNVMGQGLTVDDKQDVYAVALSHEIAEMTVDPMANGSNPEVCDSCLPPDEILLGDNKAISEYIVGSMVAGQNGLQGVTDKFVRQYDGDLVEIKALGMLPFRVTPNHPLLVVRGQSHGLMIDYLPPVWKEAGLAVSKARNHDGDYLLMPRLQGSIDLEKIDLTPYIEKRVQFLKSRASTRERHTHWKFRDAEFHKRHRPCHNCGSPMSEGARRCWDCFLREKPNHAWRRLLPKAFPLNEETAWMLGLYVAEGYPNPAHRSVELSLSEDEDQLARRAMKVFQSMGLNSNISPIPGERAVRVVCGSLILVEFLLDVCGQGAANKKIPDFILYHINEKILKSFLDGYMAGDGSSKRTKKGYEVSVFTTVSKVLALQLQLAFGRLGTFVSLRIERKARRGAILGRPVTMRETYAGSWCSDSRATRQKRLHQGVFYLPVKSVKKMPYSGPVHNLETQDHTFLASNAVVHNCAGNCSVDFRNYFDSKGNWLGGSPTTGYSFFIDGIATPATVAQCPAPKASCSYPPPKSGP